MSLSIAPKVIDTITCNLSNYRTVTKLVEKREKEGTLPEDGNLTLYTKEESKKMLEEALKDAPDCTSWGYTKAVVKAGLESLTLEKKIKNQVFSRIQKQLGPRSFFDFGPSLYEPEELAKRFANKLLKNLLPKGAAKTLPYYYVLETVQKALQASINAHYDHRSRCDGFQANIALLEEGAKKPIAILKYKLQIATSQKITKTLEIVHVSDQRKKEDTTFDELIKKLNHKKIFALIIPDETEELKSNWVNERLIEASKKIEYEKIESKKPIKTISPIRKTTLEEVYETVVGSMERVKKKVLPEGADLHVNVGSNLNKTTVNITQDVNEHLHVGANITPANWKSSTITLASDVYKSGSPNNMAGTVGANVNFYEPKNSTLMLSGRCANTSGGILLNPRSIKHSQFQGSYSFGDYSVGGTLIPSKLLKSRVSVEFPIAVYNVHLVIGMNVRLDKPLNARLKVALPLPGMNLQLLSLRPKSILNLPKKLKHNCQKIDDGFKKVFGGRTRKQKRKDARKRAEEKLRLELEFQEKKWAIDYPNAKRLIGPCYVIARSQWMIEKDMPPEEYFADMFFDWKEAVSEKKFSDSFSEFIARVYNQLNSGRFNEAHSLSPTALEAAPLEPEEFKEAIVEQKELIEEMREAVQELQEAIVDREEAQESLQEEINSLGGALESLTEAMELKREAKAEIYELIERQNELLTVFENNKERLIARDANRISPDLQVQLRTLLQRRG